MGCWFVYTDPCGLGCYLFGWFTVLFVDYVTQVHVLWPWFRGSAAGILHGAVFQALIVLILWSYLRAATTDPGSVRKGTATKADALPPADDPERLWKPKRRYCEKCACIKPPRAHHCSTCQRCINKMDHHCPWVNNCVGSNNWRHFAQFLLWTFVGSSYAALLSLWRAVECWRSRACAMPPPVDLVVVIAGTVLAIFFAIFIVAMACDQYEGVVTSTTALESMKSWDEAPRSVCEGLEEACGEPFRLGWLLPLPVPRDSPAFYEWKPSDDPDAYDPRDPVIRRHFKRIEEMLLKGVRPSPPLPEGAGAGGGAGGGAAAGAGSGSSAAGPAGGVGAEPVAGPAHSSTAEDGAAAAGDPDSESLAAKGKSKGAVGGGVRKRALGGGVS